MHTILRRLGSLLLLCSTLPLGNAGWCAKPSDVGFELSSNLPIALVKYLLSADDLDPYVLDARLNPFYLQADFNGDGSTDTAVLIKEGATGKAGILIHHGGTNEGHVLGAGVPIFGVGSDRSFDDFRSRNAWYVVPRGPVERGAHNVTDPPELRGDALMVFVLEASSQLIFWSGSEYLWYVRGD